MDKDEVRRLFPSCVEFAGQVRDVFGPGVKLTYAEEGGRSIGNKSESDPVMTVSLSEIVLDSRPMGEIIADRDLAKGKRHAK